MMKMNATMMKIKIWKECNGLKCGINAYGDLFLGDDKSGYNLRDTPENRERILKDFEYYAERRIIKSHY